MRPGWGPVFSILTFVGTVLQAESAVASASSAALVGVKLLRMSSGALNVRPPLVETFTQIRLGPKKSWYISTTRAFPVPVFPVGIQASTQSRSTPKGLQLVPHTFTTGGLATLVPYIQLAPSFVDFHTSACSGPSDWLPARLHS